MAEFFYMPWHCRAFRSDTEHLNAQGCGAYALLLMVAWDSPMCRLPDSDKKLAKWARVNARTWQKLKPEVMAFWNLEDGFWMQKRQQKEFIDAQDRAAKRRANGALGGRPKALKNIETEKPDGSYSDNQTETRAKASKVIDKPKKDNTASPSTATAQGGLAENDDLASQMADQSKRWMVSMDDAGARLWLNTLRQAYGQKAVAESYGQLKGEMLAGSVISHPLKAWSVIARRFASEATAPERLSARDKKLQATRDAREVARRMFSEDQPAQGTMHRE